MTPDTSLYLIAAGVTAFLVGLALTVALAWWVERRDPRRYERVR